MQDLPQTGFLRLPQIIGRSQVTEEEAKQNRHDAALARAAGKSPNNKPKRARLGIVPLVPICKSQWWAGVAAGRYPQPYRGLGARTTVWRVEDIRALLEGGM